MHAPRFVLVLGHIILKKFSETKLTFYFGCLYLSGLLDGQKKDGPLWAVHIKKLLTVSLFEMKNSFESFTLMPQAILAKHPVKNGKQQISGKQREQLTLDKPNQDKQNL